MTTKTEEALGLQWGASLGETPWNVWMDANLVKIGATAQISVINRTTTAPPGSFVEGNRYIVGTGATGAWSAKDGQLAVAVDGSYQFYALKKGWIIEDQSDGYLYKWNGTSFDKQAKYSDVTAAISAHNAAADPHPGYALESTIGAANGVAPLDAGSQVPAAHLGNYSTTVATDAAIDAAVADEAALRSDADTAHVNAADPHAQYVLESTIGAASGVAPLDAGSKVPAAYLPSYVDDVIESADFASLPATGETGKIYVTLDTNRSWRWSGSAYVDISNPGTTDNVVEGDTNKYFTEARVRNTPLTGLATGDNADLSATDLVLAAFGKIATRFSSLATSIANIFKKLEDVTAVASSAGALNLDLSLGNYFTLALTEDVTGITFSNLPGANKGATVLVRITQDATARTVAWPASFKWAGGAAPAVSTAAGAVDVLALTTVDNGTTWQATLSKEFA